jgi:hypothetical protein
LSATQILASGLAAASATVAASYFGVAGTVIGAGLGSVISVVGGAVFSYSIRQTRNKVRRGLDVAVAQRFTLSTATIDRAAASPSAAARVSSGVTRARAALSPRRLVLVAGAIFAVTLAITTAFELASGQPLAATLHGQHGSGVSLGGGSTGTAGPRPAPATSSSPRTSSQPSTVSTPAPATTVTVTAPASSSTPSGSTSSQPPTSAAPTSSPAPSWAPSS